MNRCTGFTFIELAIVLSLIALLALMVTAGTTFLSRMVVRAELEHVYTVCYYEQQKALMTQTPHTITFDREKRCYSAPTTTYRLPAQVQFGTMRGIKGPPSSPKDVVHAPITFPQNRITFYPDGIIQSGTIYLTDAGHNCTYALSCAVSSVSYLRKYQYTNTWQLIS